MQGTGSVDRSEHRDIRIGTLAHANRDTPNYLRQILPHGFESVQLTFGHHVGEMDLEWLAAEVHRVLDDFERRTVVSSLGLYGNPLTDEATARDWSRLITAAERFGCHMVCGFTGRLTDRAVDESLPRFVEVFGPLVRQAEDFGVRIAFENCDMHGDWQRGDWNIAHAPAAWEMIFDALPSDSLGLEWEPCHQMVSLIDPIPQLRQWAPKVFHVHGKDATIMWDVLRTKGLRGGEPYVFHRTPGFGDTNWTDVISILRLAGFRGSIDVEGWHDPVYRDELEMTGQVAALRYLQRCRGGDFVANPH